MCTVSFGGVGHALEWNERTQLPPKYHENKPREAGARAGWRAVRRVGLGVHWSGINGLNYWVGALSRPALCKVDPQRCDLGCSR